MTSFEFDEAIGRRRTAAGRYAVDVRHGWDFAGVPNGGYLMAIVVGVLSDLTGRPDPATVTAHFLTAASPGPATVEAEVLRDGRTHTSARATLVRDGEKLVEVLATLGDMSRPRSEVVRHPPLPSLPGPIDSVGAEADRGGFPAPAIAEKLELRLDPAHVGFATGAPSGEAVVQGWARFADGRPVDTTALTLLADAFPPSIFNSGLPIGWTPTVELTVHLHDRPAAGWIGCSFRTEVVTGGYASEDGLLWDETGRIVAMSRQLALVPKG